MLVDIETYFESHHQQTNFYYRNNLNQTLQVSRFYFAVLLIQLFLLMLQVFYLSQNFFTRLEISDLLIYSFSLIFASSMSIVNLL